MAKKENKYTGPKVFSWELEVDDELVIWKCEVLEHECITYEGDTVCKHLKIMDTTRKEGLLQIDTQTRVYDEVLPFQLENGIPYIKIDGEWISSDTTKEDRLQQKIQIVKKQSYGYGALGVVFLIAYAVQVLVTKSVGEWPMFPIAGILCLTAMGMNLARLRNELMAMGREFSFKI